MSLSKSVLFKAVDVGKASRGEYKFGRWARGSWLKREREEQIGTFYLLSTSAFKPKFFLKLFRERPHMRAALSFIGQSFGLTSMWLGYAVVSL